MSQLRQTEQRLDELDVQVKIVTFDDDWMAVAYIKKIGVSWPMLIDADQSLYKAYGMTRGSWWSVYGLSSVWKYLKLIFHGQRPGRPGKDWRQLGGDVLIDTQGIVRVHYVSSDPHDRPSVESLLTAITEHEQS